MAHPLLTVVSARGGSKGLPRKNARRLGDAPLFAWSYFAWREAGLPGPCWLSTEAEELAEMGRTLGMEVPFLRPPELATDEATALEVALHALDHHKASHGADPDWYLLLQPTSPLRPPLVLTEAWRQAQVTSADAILGVKMLYRSLSTLYHADERGQVTALEQHSAETRRQDVRPLLTANGALYLIRSEVLRRERTFVPGRTIAFPMDALVSVDIDDASDWVLAESVVTHGASWRGSEQTHAS